MKTYKELSTAIKPQEKTIVLFFCECNPPTLNHLVAFTATKQIAERRGADHAILLSNGRSSLTKTLTVSEKLEYTNLFFPGFNLVVASEGMNTPLDVARVYSKNYKNLIEVCGTDGIEAYKYVYEHFNTNFNNIEIISTGEIEPDLSQASLKMKKAIHEGDLKSVQKHLLAHVREIDARRFMNDCRKGMGLDAIRENIMFDTSELREKYVAGEIFLENTFVESNDQLFKIINRNSNYLTVSDNSGILSKKWLTNVQPIEVCESIRKEFEGITEMKFSSADKIKVGKIIGGMLGADVSKGSNAEQMVNAGLRITRSKTLNAEAIAILQNMLKTADDAGILYDQKLVPKLVVDKKTGETYSPEQKFSELLKRPETKAQFKRMKAEQGKGWPKSAAHEQNEATGVDSADKRWIVDPITGKGRWSRASRVTFNLKSKIPDEVVGGRTISDSVEVKEDADSVIAADADQSNPSMSSLTVPAANAETKKKIKKNEEVELAEAKRRDHEQEHTDSIRARTEQAHLKGQRYYTLYAKDQVVADTHHLHLNTLGGKQVALPVGTSLGGEDDQHVRRKVNYENDTANESILTESNHISDIILRGKGFSRNGSLGDSSLYSHSNGDKVELAANGHWSHKRGQYLPTTGKDASSLSKHLNKQHGFNECTVDELEATKDGTANESIDDDLKVGDRVVSNGMLGKKKGVIVQIKANRYSPHYIVKHDNSKFVADFPKEKLTKESIDGLDENLIKGTIPWHEKQLAIHQAKYDELTAAGHTSNHAGVRMAKTNIETHTKQIERKHRVNECTVDELEATKDGNNITDAEIDDMIAHVDNWDDIVGLYDSSELSYVDAESGQHITDVPDKFFGYEGDPIATPDEREVDAPDSSFVAGPPKMRESEISEIVSRVERIKMGVQHYTNSTNRPVKVALKHRSNAAQLGRKAHSLAVKTLKLNMAKKPLNQLSTEEKSRIERIVMSKGKLIHRIAVRLMPKIRKIEQNHMSHANFTKD